MNISLLIVLLVIALAALWGLQRQRQIAAAAFAEARHFRQLFEKLPLPLGYANGQKGTIDFVNTRFVEAFGYTQDEVPTLEAWYARAYPDPTYRRRAVEEWGVQVGQAIEKGMDIPLREYQITCKNGSVRSVMISGVCFGSNVLAVFDDITERKQATVALANFTRDFEAFLDQTTDFIYFKDANSRIRFCSQAMATITGYTDWRKMIGKHDREIFPPDTAKIYEEEEWLIFSEGKPLLNKIDPYYDEKGGGGYVQTNKWPLFDAGGQVVGIFGISRDISEMKRIEAELCQYRDHLEDLVLARTTELVNATQLAERANRAKSVFLANMSHELRTPLNAILGFAQIMARDARIPDEQRKNLATINRSGQYLLALINDVLEISRIESGRLTASLAPFDLLDLLNSITESMALRARDKGLVLHLEVAPNLPAQVITDNGKLRQILLNLLSNAVKYTRSGDIVLTATVLTRDDHAVTLDFVVRDTGVGIPIEELEQIFSPFYQTDVGIRQGEGTGLGLAISREYSRLLGGELTAASTPGVGSQFRLKLPVTLTDVPIAAVPQGRVRALSVGEPHYRVLVAEDEPVNQELLRLILEDVGFEARLASNGQEAVEIFKQWRPQFVWMDMRMPVMDGFEATRVIRALPQGKDVPIVAFTASAFAEDRIAILAAGCNEVMTKPLEENRLFALMTCYLGVRFDYDAPVLETSILPGEVDFSPLPAPILQRLHAAAIALDAETVRTIASEISVDYPNLSQYLQHIADNYRYQDLQQQLEGSP